MIYLGSRFGDCPKHWQNYIKTVNPGGRLCDAEVDKITREVWRGHMHYLDEKHLYVEFESPEAETMFNLRWR